MPPELILVGGPNGAGKTTFVESFLTSGPHTYLGADQIAYELCPDNVESVAFESGRIFVERIREYRDERRDLIVESTLSGKSLVAQVKKYREVGYFVRVIFITLPSVGISAERVSVRVTKGGHNVPPEDILRRFSKTHKNFWNLYRPLADRWFLYTNQRFGHELVAAGQGESYSVASEIEWETFLWKLKD